MSLCTVVWCERAPVASTSAKGAVHIIDLEWHRSVEENLMASDSSYIPIGHAIRRARIDLELNQHELSDRLNSVHTGHWSQGKISRIEVSDRELSLQEFMQLSEVLGIDALRGTYELDQILDLANDYAHALKTAMLNAIDGLESAHKALTDGLS